MDQDELLSIYQPMTDEEVNIMYEDYSIAEAIKERMNYDKDYRIS